MNGAAKTGYLYVKEWAITKNQIKTLTQSGPDLNV